MVRRRPKRTFADLLPNSAPQNPHYVYLRATQLEGTYPEDAGSWSVSAHRALKAFGYLDVTEMPYKPIRKNQWPISIPDQLEPRARRNRIQAYQRVRSAEECVWALSRGCPPQVVVEATEGWRGVRDEIIEPPVANDAPPLLHAVQVVAYDESLRAFVFANSWGTDWGVEGFGRFSFDYLDACLAEAWVKLPPATGIRDSLAALPRGVEKLRVTTWGREDLFKGFDPLADVLHAIEVWDGVNDEVLAWAFAERRGLYLDVEELFVMPTSRRQGLCRLLIGDLLRLSRGLRAPLRLWFPHADSYPEGQAIREAITRRLGVGLARSDARWAGWVGCVGLESAAVRKPRWWSPSIGRPGGILSMAAPRGGSKVGDR